MYTMDLRQAVPVIFELVVSDNMADCCRRQEHISEINRTTLRSRFVISQAEIYSATSILEEKRSAVNGDDGLHDAFNRCQEPVGR